MKTLLLLVLSATLFALSDANIFTDQLTGCPATNPRVRTAWGDLTSEQKKTYAYIVYYMKLEQGIWCKGNGLTTPLYDVFVYIHKSDLTSAGWHGTPFFLPAHKWFLWVYESAFRLIAWKYWQQVGLSSQTDACNLALCYWDWLLDYDDNAADNDCPIISKNWSGIWDADAFGDQYPDVADGSYYVDDGICYLDGWINVMATSPNKNYPTVSKYQPFDKYLKRRIECIPNTKANSYSLTLGPSQAMQTIVNYKAYSDFEPWIEGGPHGLPHMFCGISMSQMFSPDDPIFFLHHCNVDRLWHLWIDCQGYENIDPTLLKSNQYSNYLASRGYTQYSISSEIPYYWDSQVSEVLPKVGGKWPTPSKLWSVGYKFPGFDGINYRYGPDNLVRTYGKTCPDQTWNIVDVGYKPTKKRDESIHPRLHGMVDNFEGKLNEGKTHLVALHEMAMEECQSAPKNEIGSQLKNWIDMMNLKPEQFDTICDKPSERQAWKNQVDEEDENVEENHGDERTITKDISTNAVPLWGIIVASVGSALLLIAVVSIVIMITIRRKSKDAENAGSYREM